MKKFDNFISNLNILSKAQNEDLTNEFIISGIIDKFFIQFELCVDFWWNSTDHSFFGPSFVLSS